jgi:hypothetical protein
MVKKGPANVTMRVRIGESEIEVTGPGDFVEKKIAEFVEKQKQAPVTQILGSRKGAIPAAKETGHTPAKTMSAAQFFRKITPKTDVDRVLAAGYFLEKFENQDSFVASEISATIRGAKIPPPRNTNDAINKNIKKGYMMPSGDKEGKMAFVLTSDGEDTMAELFSA